MNRYPNFPGHKGGDTSEGAAQAMAPHLNRLQNIALNAILAAGDRGLTKEEVAAPNGIPEKSIGPRVSELAKKGLVQDSGKRRPNETGKMAKVWVAVSGAGEVVVRISEGSQVGGVTVQCELR